MCYGTEDLWKIWRGIDLSFQNFMILESDAKFEEKWLLVWKMTWRIWQTFTWAHKVSKLGLLLDPFIQSRQSMSLKFTRVLCVMTMKNDTKFVKELTCLFKIDMRNLTNFDLSTRKSQKICTLMGCFWPKYVMFELKKYRKVMFNGTKYWFEIWRKTDLCFQKWHEEFSKFSPDVWKSKNWDFYWVVLSKIENVWA